MVRLAHYMSPLALLVVLASCSETTGPAIEGLEDFPQLLGSIVALQGHQDVAQLVCRTVYLELLRGVEGDPGRYLPSIRLDQVGQSGRNLFQGANELQALPGRSEPWVSVAPFPVSVPR